MAATECDHSKLDINDIYDLLMKLADDRLSFPNARRIAMYWKYKTRTGAPACQACVLKETPFIFFQYGKTFQTSWDRCLNTHSADAQKPTPSTLKASGTPS